MFQRLLDYLQLDRKFLVLIFLFSYFTVVAERIKAGMVSWYTFTPEGPLVQFCFALVIFVVVRYWINRLTINTKLTVTIWRYSAIALMTLVLYLALTNSISLVIALIFNTVQRNFNGPTLLANNLSNIVDVLLYTSIYLAYYHYQQLNLYRNQLNDYNQQLTQLKIQQLKAQLNPHFIFNSLNTLDELICQNPEQASEYLHHFAGLYRLSLQNSQQQLIAVSQEVEFAEHYFNLMQGRLGAGYYLTIKDAAKKALGTIPPFTLQVLLENVFCHNQGSAKMPVEITITLKPDSIEVSNPLRPKITPQVSNGIGLSNLSRQLQFLTGQDLNITNDGKLFNVSVPIVTESTPCLMS
ncbi:sensor histidine kinase [Rheinheimera sp. MMS21-TC3]|uniref:sensor histidine kinase n=1 Tax=Rheinheimera sp. MMS21-TC3 TaxID=3072790 RepID=UPI0028C479AA|nr:histidine kinase [Rheinheimera sp. MMS21-TC3]WNO59612.1 histidine kinase [Rheinheimera sp. MMS21-TC3]